MERPQRERLPWALIANLTDDDGDGDVDENDIPDIVYISVSGRLVVLDGATGGEHWAATGYQGYAIGTWP
ncbi:MAG: hypothetical protein IPN01_17840 [Deltaproteobacteria bacterium]|nr:hypothetical protein [Deltaproteobacteria bacterium]